VGRRALGILYGGVALLGVLHLDPWTTLLAVPFFSILAAGLRWSIHEALHGEATPSIQVLFPAATAGGLFAPFAMR
jgi:fatty acid desaturase